MSAIRLRGATSGTTDVVAAAIAGDGVMTLPPGTGTLATEASVATAKAEAIAAGIAGGGLVAVAPTSIANSGGSASTTGNTTTFTGVTALSLNGIFSATYLNYLALIVVTPTASSQYMRSRLRLSGVDATGANYDMQQVEFFSGTTSANILTNQTSWRTCFLATDGDTCITIEFYRPDTSANTLFKTNSAQPTEAIFGGGDHDLATAYDGLTIYPDTGTITGTITVYGYAK